MGVFDVWLRGIQGQLFLFNVVKCSGSGTVRNQIFILAESTRGSLYLPYRDLLAACSLYLLKSLPSFMPDSV